MLSGQLCTGVYNHFSNYLSPKPLMASSVAEISRIIGAAIFKDQILRSKWRS